MPPGKGTIPEGVAKGSGMNIDLFLDQSTGRGEPLVRSFHLEHVTRSTILVQALHASHGAVVGRGRTQRSSIQHASEERLVDLGASRGARMGPEIARQHLDRPRLGLVSNTSVSAVAEASEPK